MLLKMTAGLSGPELSLSPGDQHEFEIAEALRLVEAGFAVMVDEVANKPSAIERRSRKGRGDVVSSESNGTAI